MRFETNPQLILSQDEFKTLDKALKLCRDMDEETNNNSCQSCPIVDNCTCKYNDCVYAVAHKALKKIIDMAVIK